MKTVTYDDTKWRLVPVEPTEEMVDEGCRQHICEQGDPHYSEPPLGYGDCVEVYMAMLDAAPTSPESSAWISVTERLPALGVEVLVYRPTHGRARVTALARFIRYEGDLEYYWDNYYGGSNIHFQRSITHWMPMPVGPIDAAMAAKAGKQGAT